MDNSYNEEDFFKVSDLNLASLENLGGAITALGYLLISLSGKKEYYNILTDSESSPSPIQLLLNGQILILIGYYILWRVSSSRVLTYQLKNSNIVSSQKKIETSYLLSILANALRLEGFLEIYEDENNN